MARHKKVTLQELINALDHAINTESRRIKKEIILNYALSKSLRLPDFAIDEIGIQPDYFIDKDIPSYKWVTHVIKLLNH